MDEERNQATAELGCIRAEFAVSIRAIEESMVSRFSGYEHQISLLKAEKSESENLNESLRYVSSPACVEFLKD